MHRSSNTNSSGEAATIEKLVQRAPLLPLGVRIGSFAPLQIMVCRYVVALLLLALESKYSTLFLQNPNAPRLCNRRRRYCRAGITFDGLAARDRPTRRQRSYFLGRQRDTVISGGGGGSRERSLQLGKAEE